MVDFEYMKLPLSMFPQEIVEQYNLKDHVAVRGYAVLQVVLIDNFLWEHLSGNFMYSESTMGV